MNILSDEEIKNARDSVWGYRNGEVPISEEGIFFARAIEAAVVEKLKEKAWNQYVNLVDDFSILKFMNELFEEQSC